MIYFKGPSIVKGHENAIYPFTHKMDIKFCLTKIPLFPNKYLATI